MKTTDITAYQTSTDYALLVKLMRGSSILCTVRDIHFAHMRQPAATRFLHEEDSEPLMTVGSPGIGYVDARSEEEFIQQCASAEVEFIPPTNSEHTFRDDAKMRAAARAFEMLNTPSTSLPTVAGFYWWRERPVDLWRVVQLIDRGDDIGRLLSYDETYQSWRGRPVWTWEKDNAVGEWLYMHPPAQPTDPVRLCNHGVPVDRPCVRCAAPLPGDQRTDASVLKGN